MKKINYVYTIIGTLIIILISLALNGFLPFGDKTFIAGDLQVQYLDFMTYLINMFRDNNFNLFYSFDVSMGFDFMSLFSYYLSSPITIFILYIASYFNEISMPYIIAFIIIVKICICSLSMYYFLTNHFKSESISAVIFSFMYAFCGFNLIYLENMMWLDGVIMLPIVCSIIDRYLDGKSGYWITLSIALMMFSNYYSGYIVILASGLYYIYATFLKEDNISVKYLLTKLFKYIYYVAFGCFLVAFILFPTMFTVFINRTGQDYNTTFSGLNNFKSIFQVFIGMSNYETSKVYPLLYSTITCICLLIFGMINKKENRKLKILNIIILTLLMAGIFIPFIDKVWHLFQIPLGYPFRYTFCISFFLIVISYQSYLKIDRNKKSWLLLILIPIYLLGMFYKYSYFIKDYLIINIIVISIVTIVIVYSRKNALLAIIVIELIFNTVYVQNEAMQYYQNYSAYESYNRKIFEILPKNIGNFRIEKTFVQDRLEPIAMNNESMTFGYNSITSYSSVFNADLNNALDKLGYQIWTFAPVYTNINPFIDSLLGVKYIISNNVLPYNLVAENGYYLYENLSALPITFVSKYNIENTINDNVIANQNYIFNNLFGVNLFEEIDMTLISSNNLYELSENQYAKNDMSMVAYSDYSIEVGENQLIFLMIEEADVENVFILIINDKELRIQNSENYRLNYLFESNDTGKTNIRIMQESGISKYSNIKAYAMDKDKLDKLNTIVTNEVNQGKYEFIINANLEEYLYISTPYIDGMKIIHNGNHIIPDRWLDEFIKIPLEIGPNKIQIHYLPNGFILGAITSIISFIVLICRLIYLKKRDNL